MPDVRTFCRVCEPACGLVADVEDGRLAALRPDREHPISHGWACNKGIATFDIHHDPDRLSYPLKRTPSGSFERVSWDRRWRKLPPSCAPSATPRRLVDGDLHRQSDRVQRADRGRHDAISRRARHASDLQRRHAGLQQQVRRQRVRVTAPARSHPVPDFDHTDYLLILGRIPACRT